MRRFLVRGIGARVALMVHYTDALSRLVADIVRRVEPLSFIDMSRLVVFARQGRSDAAGPYATCHSLNLPTSEPGYYFWRDRETGRITRRTECFVTRTPEVRIRDRRIDYLLSFSVPRFCDQTLEASRKAGLYHGCPSWMAKLDTVVHELYHIPKNEVGLRRVERADGGHSSRSHGPTFFEDVACFVRLYLDTRPDPSVVEFLHHDFTTLERLHGHVVGTTFTNFPSFPQRYAEALATQPDAGDALIVPVRPSSQPARYTELNLESRVFTRTTSRRSDGLPWHRAA